MAQKHPAYVYQVVPLPDQRMDSPEIAEQSKVIPPSQNVRKSPLSAINKEMFRYKLHFFLYTAGFGTTFPYGSVIGITQYGLTAGNLAATFVVQKILTLLIKPLIGYFTDYFNSLKASIMVLACLHALFYFCLIVIPERDIDPSQQIPPLDNDSACRLCEIFKIAPPNNLYNRSISEELQCFGSISDDVKRWQIYCINQHKNYSSTLVYTVKKRGSLTHALRPSKTCRNFQHINNTELTLLSYFSDSDIVNIVCFPKKNKASEYINSTSVENSILGDNCHHIQKRELDAFSKSDHVFAYPDLNFTCDTTSPEPKTVEDSSPRALDAFETYQYYLFSLCLIGANLFGLAIHSLSDTACHEAIHNTKSTYGQQRFWGSLSWAIMAPLAGLLNDYTEGYMASGFVMTFIFALLFWNLSGIQLKKPEFTRGRSGKDLKSVLGSRTFMAFELGVFMNGLFAGLIWSHLAWWYTTIGGSRLVVGLCYSVEMLIEAPCFFFSGWFIEKLGHFNVVSLALFTYGVRFFLYSCITNPWFALPVEALDGVTHGLFYAAITSFGKLSSKPGIEASTQTVITLTYEALGAGVGSLISGVGFELLGSQSTFRYTALVCALAGSINVILTLLLKLQQTRSFQKQKSGLDDRENGQPFVASSTLTHKPRIV